MVHGVCTKAGFLRLDDLSIDLVHPAGVVPDRADGQLIFGDNKGLATVRGLDRGQVHPLSMRDEFAEKPTASFTGYLTTPGVFKGLLGSFDSGVDVDRRTIRDLISKSTSSTLKATVGTHYAKRSHQAHCPQVNSSDGSNWDIYRKRLVFNHVSAGARQREHGIPSSKTTKTVPLCYVCCRLDAAFQNTEKDNVCTHFQELSDLRESQDRLLKVSAYIIFFFTFQNPSRHTPVSTEERHEPLERTFNTKV